MRLSSLFISGAAFLFGAALCLVAASFAVSGVEIRTEIGVRAVLDDATHDWAEVEADGLKVILAGTAADEATRFAVLSLVGKEVDSARIIDMMQIAPGEDITAPRFSVEILRNDSGISIIGLVPAETDRKKLTDQLGRINGGQVSDLLQVAHYPVPRGWQDAMSFAVIALEKLPRSKISVSAGQVVITAISDSMAAKQALQATLNRAAPPGLRLALDISAPRPVITPFTLRYLIDAQGGRFDACSADTAAASARIMDAARHAGLSDKADCIIGMGSPSPNWAKSAALAMQALARLGQGSVTMSDADITLVAEMGTDAALFDRVVGELDTALPAVFALHAVLPQPAEPGQITGPSEFTATLSPEGLVQLRGRLSDENLRHMADSYARARFGSEAVYTATRIIDGMPPDWPVRVLSGLEALSMLVNGALSVTPDTLTLSGVSEREEASSEIAALLADKLGSGGAFSLDITYREPPEPVDTAPDPEVCEADLEAAQSVSKISFEPGSAKIAAGALDTMNAIANILDKCGEIRLEIQGHTDSQGREVMNQQLSQARAQSVLNELRARRVLTSSYVAVGYGESQPIADNKTEEGREDNRRIEFRLIRPKLVDEAETTLESAEQDMSSSAGGTGQADAAEPVAEAGSEDSADTTEPDNTNAEADGKPDAAGGEDDTNEQN